MNTLSVALIFDDRVGLDSSYLHHDSAKYGCKWLNGEGPLFKTQAIFEFASVYEAGSIPALCLDLGGLQNYVLTAPRSNNLH